VFADVHEDCYAVKYLYFEQLNVLKQFFNRYSLRENKMKLVSTLLVLAFAVALSGCNTFAGAGKDIQKGGEKIEDAAESNK